MATKKFPAKDANDSLDYQFDWAEFLVEGETITDATVTASPSGELLIAGIVAGETAVTFRASEGEVGSTYTVTCEIETTAGNIVNRKATLPVKDL